MNDILQRMALALCALSALAAPAGALALAYPTKPMTIVAAYPAGGVADQMARVVATELTKVFGQPVTTRPFRRAPPVTTLCSHAR
jgi:tripartite-type tricarboxylate transporter receptor subunit TctC